MFSKRIGLLTFLLWVVIPCAAFGQATPGIGSLGSGGENWDAIWISGAGFETDSRVYVYTADWSAYQIFWGPDWGISPSLSVSGDGSLISLQVTDPAVRYSFGNSLVHVLVVNPEWLTSEWWDVNSPPPVITAGDAGCADLYCIWLTGWFPLNATVEFRPHGQPDVLSNSYSSPSVTLNLITLALNSSVHYAYDTVGLDAWAVNTLFPNWSGGYYLPPKDRSVIGNIDGIVLSGLQYYLRGWACAKTNPGSIAVHLFAGGPAGAGTFVTSAAANLSSNPATTASCNTGGTSYGFSILLPLALRQQFGGQTIFVHGISPLGLANSLLDNSGNLSIPAPVAASSKEYIYLGGRVLAVDTTNLP